MLFIIYDLRYGSLSAVSIHFLNGSEKDERRTVCLFARHTQPQNI